MGNEESGTEWFLGQGKALSGKATAIAVPRSIRSVASAAIAWERKGVCMASAVKMPENPISSARFATSPTLSRGPIASVVSSFIGDFSIFWLRAPMLSEGDVSLIHFSRNEST